MFEEGPMIQKTREEHRVNGCQEELQEARQEEIQRLQCLLVNIFRAKYPKLGELAQQQVSHFCKPDALGLLIMQVVTAPDESKARWLLESSIVM